VTASLKNHQKKFISIGMSPSVYNGNSMTPHINHLIPPVLSYTMPSGYHSATILCVKLPSHLRDFNSNLIIEQHDSCYSLQISIFPHCNRLSNFSI